MFSGCRHGSFGAEQSITTDSCCATAPPVRATRPVMLLANRPTEWLLVPASRPSLSNRLATFPGSVRPVLQGISRLHPSSTVNGVRRTDRSWHLCYHSHDDTAHRTRNGSRRRVCRVGGDYRDGTAD